ncbi:DNA alkylation repair enzyme [Pirellula sp. SH-Sr6A]|uniref:DNA alkylation repair protein n=1 Tax=Pirellula sp. SH-Sr6A TaxID=1632865 RepID=UPI00078D1BA0|nr:DNA alkylation repair protein [Pirellula sp. SH-Sr6A]AMV31491.1 DNA alkylation repair enzyme [Pirellula sp. SH-Sr6A]
MTSTEIVAELKRLGNEGTARVLRNHGAHDPCLGVKIGDLKPIQKRLKKNYSLSLELYGTGIYDAMYLAGLIADPEQMTKTDLTGWVASASNPIASYVVGPIAAGSPAGWSLALSWIQSKKEIENIAGWSTLSAIASICPDEKLDLDEYQRLLADVEGKISQTKDAVRYQMNSFVIAVGSYIRSLTETAMETGNRIGVLTVEMGNTDCNVPFAPDYIRKVEARGAIGKKRKTAMC